MLKQSWCWLMIGLGWLALAVGFVGIVVPLLPTTPFVLLAAYFFSKGSTRLHQWLRGHPRFGWYRPRSFTRTREGRVPRRVDSRQGVKIAKNPVDLPRSSFEFFAALRDQFFRLRTLVGLRVRLVGRL